MTRKVFLQLFPLFILYCTVFFVLAEDSLDFGDESRYATYAENLTKGFYAPSDTRALPNGPGYPLLLTPFAFLGIPWYWAKMLNPVFMFLAVCFIYSAIRNYMSEKTALFFTYLFGLYPPFYAELWFLLTEPFALMLVSLFAFLTIKWYSSGRYRYMLLAAVICALIALTKVFFGYVASAALLLSMVLSKWSQTSRKTVPIYSIALLLCVPYLFYTYSLTGKFFYWGNSGGLSLYWMSSPYQTDLGDWHSPDSVANIPELAHNHGEFFREIEQLPSIERDDALVGQALRNIARNPVKYITNWMANVGRLLFNYPYSHTQQKLSTFFYLVPNAFLVVIAVLSVYPAYLGRKSVPYELWALGVFALISFGGSSLLSAYGRQLVPLVPVLVLWIAFTWIRIVEVRLRY